MAKAKRKDADGVNGIGLAPIDATVIGKALAKAGTIAGKDGADLAPGAYDFDATLRISGQAIVGQPSERKTEIVTKLAGLTEIVVAAFSECPELKKFGLEALLDKGTRALKSARRSAAGREKLEIESKALAEAVDRAIDKAGLVTVEPKTTPVAGACRVEPDVVIVSHSVLQRKD